MLHEGGEEIQYSLFSVLYSECILQHSATTQTNVHPGIVHGNWKHPTVRPSQQKTDGYASEATELRQFKVQHHVD